MSRGNHGVERAEKSNQRRAVNRMFGMLDQGLGWDEIGAVMDRGKEKGEESEERVLKVLEGMEEVVMVRKADKREDLNVGIDIVARFNTGCEWKIQVKSSREPTIWVIKKLMNQWRMPDGRATVKKMAQKGWMVINARYGEEDGCGEGRIEDQIWWWIGVRSGTIRV